MGLAGAGVCWARLPPSAAERRVWFRRHRAGHWPGLLSRHRVLTEPRGWVKQGLPSRSLHHLLFNQKPPKVTPKAEEGPWATTHVWWNQAPATAKWSRETLPWNPCGQVTVGLSDGGGPGSGRRSGGRWGQGRPAWGSLERSAVRSREEATGRGRGSRRLGSA